MDNFSFFPASEGRHEDMLPGEKDRRYTFSKVCSLVIVYSEFSGGLTSEKFCQQRKMLPGEKDRRRKEVIARKRLERAQDKDGLHIEVGKLQCVAGCCRVLQCVYTYICMYIYICICIHI